MGLYPGAACKLNLWNERLGKGASSDSNTKDGIETVRLCAFAPPGSPLDRHRVVAFLLSMNNFG